MTPIQLKLPPIIDEGSFAIRASETDKALEMDVFRELVNKIAWALGTCYDRPYSNMKCQARKIAVDLATSVVVDQGWPIKIKRK